MKTAPIFVGDDAWIGANAVVLPGVTIGARAIVGAGAVVIQDVACEASSPAFQLAMCARLRDRLVSPALR